MGKKMGLAVLVAALLVSGLLVGVSQGSSSVARGSSFSVVSGEILAERHKGLVGQLREEMLDENGDRIGTIRWTCIQGSDYTCTTIYGFGQAASNGSGSMVTSGLFRGFNDERIPVTGGSDAYFDAGGEVTLSVVGGEYTHTFDLAA